jgi:hypothetical protein
MSEMRELHDGATVVAWHPVRDWISRHRLPIDGVYALVFWVAVLVKPNTAAYVLAGSGTLKVMFDLAWLKARSAGAPEWSASEAYITRWRGWRRALRTDA